MNWELFMIKCTILLVFGLLLLFDLCSLERIPLEYTWTIMNLSMFLAPLKTKPSSSTICKDDSNLRTFQFKWLKINPIFVTFLTDFVLLKEYIKSLKVQVELPQNFVEMCDTKSYSSHKNLSFNAFLDCYQISHLHSWVHAENCCTCIDKIHSKTKVFLIIFSWNLYSN